LLFVGDPSVPILHQPAHHLNNDQPAQPVGDRIAYLLNLQIKIRNCLNELQPFCRLNNDQPAQPPGGRIAYRQMISL
jgi:hypothetical protein